MNKIINGIIIAMSLLTISGGAIAGTIYGIGASWTSNGPDNPPGSTLTGDETNSDGLVWLEIVANDTGEPLPISSSQTPVSSAQTATNFSRGGANISASSGTGGTDRPYDAGEQVTNLGAYLTTNSITLDDTHTLAFSAGGMAANDIIDQFEIDPVVINATFMNTLISETEADITAAMNLGFLSIFILNMPDLTMLPGIQAVLTPSELTDLDSVVTMYNTDLTSTITTLQAAFPNAEFVTVDVHTLIASVGSSPSTYGFTDATTVLYTDGSDTGTATGADPATTAWFDPLHPSAALHAHIAEAASTAGSTVSTDSSDSGGGGSFDIWITFLLLMSVFGIKMYNRKSEDF